MGVVLLSMVRLSPRTLFVVHVSLIHTFVDTHSHGARQGCLWCRYVLVSNACALRRRFLTVVCLAVVCMTTVRHFFGVWHSLDLR